MAEKLGILVVSYGSRAAAMMDALSRSEYWNPVFYVADKQANPCNIQKAEESGGEHKVIGGLNVDGIIDFAKSHSSDIEFALVGPEGPIIDGIGDRLEQEADVRALCPKRDYAIEGSKVRQRVLISRSVPKANPAYRVFSLKGQLDPATEGEFIREYGNSESAEKDLRSWYDELGGNCVIKPDKATAGKGVVVSGDHFSTYEQAKAHFLDILGDSAVLVEEKLIGEESSFMGFSDGRTMRPFPQTRDYKRAFKNDRGPNTGGMGSYKDNRMKLPFMSKYDVSNGTRIAQMFFDELKGSGSNDGVKFIPTYLAYMHTHDGIQILECNNRGGDPEIMNILPVLKNDFIGVCEEMLAGKLSELHFRPQATVVTYKVPPSYGGRNRSYSGSTEVDLTGAYELQKKIGDHRLRIYPGSMALKDGKTHSLSSRAVAVVGIGNDIQEARETSLSGIRAIKGGSLWHRTDIASGEHIEHSVFNMESLGRQLHAKK